MKENEIYVYSGSSSVDDHSVSSRSHVRNTNTTVFFKYKPSTIKKDVLERKKENLLFKKDCRKSI